jgi:microcompartment protein CcmK/EutM
MAYTTVADAAAKIRTALKGYGYTSRDISVKSESFSMGSAIRVTIKNAAVPLSLVRLVAEAHEDISRCSVTGDILSGGNRYVTISFSTEARAALAAKHLPAVEAAIATLREDPNDRSLHPVATAPGALVGLDHNGYGYDLWAANGGRVGNYYDAAALAGKIGEIEVSAGV